MKVLTVDDSVSPFAVEPSNGSTAITVTPRTASSGGGGAALNAVGVDELASTTPLDPNATLALCTVNLTTQGNAMKITYSGLCNVVLGTGAQPDATFDVTIDGNGVPELDGEVGFTSPGVAATSSLTFGRSFWIFFQTAGVHTIVLEGNFSGIGSSASVRDGCQLSVEDWTFP